MRTMVLVWLYLHDTKGHIFGENNVGKSSSTMVSIWVGIPAMLGEPMEAIQLGEALQWWLLVYVSIKSQVDQAI